MGGGQDKPAWTACPPGVKITRVGGKITQDSFPPWGQAVKEGQDKLLHPPVHGNCVNALCSLTLACILIAATAISKLY